MDDNTLRELKRIREDLDDIIERAERDNGAAAETEYKRWFRRVGSVLNAVEQAGGSITVDEWREIGLRHNYDPRGLAGFYTGKDPSMKRDPDTDLRHITDRGKLDAANWRRLFGNGQ